MRILVWVMLAIGAFSAVGPAAAQAWDPNYPVCLQVYTRNGSYNECQYTSLPQCAASASGRAAECMVNPFFAKASVPMGPRRHRRQR